MTRRRFAFTSRRARRSQRAALANTLLDSLEPNDESVQEAWDREVERRMEDLKAGRAVTVPWEELRRELLAKVDGR